MSSNEPESVQSPSARQFAAMSEFITELANLTRKTNVLISTTFQLGHRHDGDFTAIQFNYDRDADTYRAVPVTYTRTLGGQGMTVTTVTPDELEALCWGATVAGIEPRPQITSHFRNGTEVRRELILPDAVYEARIAGAA